MKIKDKTSVYSSELNDKLSLCKFRLQSQVASHYVAIASYQDVVRTYQLPRQVTKLRTNKKTKEKSTINGHG